MQEKARTASEVHRPSVSFVVPIYNAEKTLDQCLGSISAQTLEDIEVVCVNDGSTDESKSIIEDFCARDARFHLLDKSNSGYGDSMNHCMKRATGEYVGIVESDDWLAENMAELLYSAAQRHDEPDIVKGCYWRVCNPDAESQTIVPAFYYQHISTTDVRFTIDEDADLLMYHPSIWSALYRRSFLENTHIAFMAEPGAAWVDNPFMMEAATAARSIVYIDEPVYYYREFNQGSSSLVKDPRIIFDRWLDMDNILKRKGITAPKVLEAHYSRGCWSIQELLTGFPQDPLAKKGIREIVERIDYDAVYRSTKILQAYKDAYQSQVKLSTRLAHKLKRAR